MASYDVIIIGAGPAGLAAATALAEEGRGVLLLDRMGGGGELMNLGTLRDVTPEQTGPELAGALLERAIEAGAELMVAEVTGLARAATGWVVETDDGDTHDAGAVVLAVGLAPGTLGLAEESRFTGQGLSHCAACDGPLYTGQPVVVAGHDRWAVAEAEELSGIAGSVTLVTQGGPAPAIEGVAVVVGHVTGLAGDSGLESVQLADPTPREIPARAIFVQCDRLAAVDFAPVSLDAAGGVREPLRPGLFVIGDARAGSARTIAAAYGDAESLVWALGKSRE
jgi:thioredoxin reductase (NADPH)